MFVNIHFNNIHSKNISELYLYTKIRAYAKDNGGYYSGMELSKNDKYNIIPKLIKKGWITGNKVIKYRNVCLKEGVVMVWAKIQGKHLESLSSFKGFLIASVESSALQSRHKHQKNIKKELNIRDKTVDVRHWDNVTAAPYWLKIKKMNGQYLGRVYNSHISKLTGLSTKTIGRWRKHSENNYRYSTHSEIYPEIKGRTSEQCFTTSKGKYCTKDLTILTNINVFTTRYTGTKL